MNKPPLYVIALIAVIAVGAFIIADRASAPRVSEADANNSELVALGETVYADNCASCHGKNLEGQPNWQNDLADGTFPAPPHDETGHTWHHPDQLLFDYTKLGGAGVLPAKIKSKMPAFKDILSDREIWAVLAFIKRSWPEELRQRHQEMNKRASQSK